MFINLSLMPNRYISLSDEMLTRGESGERNLMTQRTVFRGPVKKIPYKSIAVNSKFIWQPVCVISRN